MGGIKAFALIIKFPMTPENLGQPGLKLVGKDLN